MNCNGWANDVTWSPSGNLLAGVSHDSQLHICNTADVNSITEHIIQWNGKPFFRMGFTDEDNLYCCGFDKIPIFYKKNEIGRASCRERVSSTV